MYYIYGRVRAIPTYRVYRLYDMCFCYWPMVKGETKNYGQITVKLLLEEIHVDYNLRKFEINEDKAGVFGVKTFFTVTQFHFLVLRNCIAISVICGNVPSRSYSLSMIQQCSLSKTLSPLWRWLLSLLFRSVQQSCFYSANISWPTVKVHSHVCRKTASVLIYNCSKLERFHVNN